MAQRKFRIQVDGQWFDVVAEEVVDDSVNAPPRRTEPSDQPAQPPVPSALVHRAAAAGVTSIDAPLPGTVLDIKVAEGQRVEIGQILVILEAMKMENEIRAEIAGEIKQIAVEKGQSVAAGDPLLILG